ncbi:hypothetical protein [uncultured Clostridium sp.]|uniref:hypothetical protein n=1 Tax=uncultured Clostridium sp. TaxID=59620 RepID=UPI0028F1493A|nr:hypothetical protein [uncultured Clostridium sp.]
MSWTYFLKLLAFTLVVIISYNLLKIFVLSKYKPNKWIIFAVAIAVLTSTNMAKISYNTLPGLAASAIFAMAVLWFVDLFNDDRLDMKKEKKSDVKIKPKAKPNRVKNNKEK